MAASRDVCRDLRHFSNQVASVTIASGTAWAAKASSVSDIGQALKAGQITPQAAIERVVERVVARQAGAKPSPNLRRWLMWVEWAAMCRQDSFGIMGIVLLLATGCSSSGGKTSGPDGSAGAGGTAADGATTLRETGATDLSAGGNADAGGSSRATEVCVAALKTHVERIYFCSGSTNEYQKYTAACPDYYFSPDSTRSVEEVAACLADLASQPCSDLQIGLSLPCINRRGKRPAGAGCSFTSQCQSTCGSSTTCSTCAPDPVSTGEKCNNAFDCKPSDYCNYNSRTCVATASITRVAEGEACDLYAIPAILCTGDLVCSNKQCVKPATGTACGNARCPPSTFCKDDKAGTCVDRVGLGQPCSEYSSEGQPLCSFGLRCANGKCAEHKTVGAPCDDADKCGEFLQCVSGVCQILTCAP